MKVKKVFHIFVTYVSIDIYTMDRFFSQSLNKIHFETGYLEGPSDVVYQWEIHDLADHIDTSRQESLLS